MQKPHRRKKWLRIHFLHRYTGLTAAFLAILLSITGILLNHTEELELHSHHASTPWLLSLYGIKAPDINTAYSLSPAKKSKTWAIEFADSIYLNEKLVQCKPPLTGAIETEGIIIISNPTQLCLLTLQGELIDRLSTRNKNTIRRLGKSKDAALIVDTKQNWLTLNTDYTELTATQKKAVTPIDWKVASPLPSALSASLIKAYKGDGLPWERVILDLHSGRIVGLAGVYFMDFIALLMIFLAVTGVIMWSRRRGPKRRSMKRTTRRK